MSLSKTQPVKQKNIAKVEPKISVQNENQAALKSSEMITPRDAKADNTMPIKLQKTESHRKSPEMTPTKNIKNVIIHKD